MVRSLWTDTLGQYDGGTRQNGGMRNRASEPGQWSMFRFVCIWISTFCYSALLYFMFCHHFTLETTPFADLQRQKMNATLRRFKKRVQI